MNGERWNRSELVILSERSESVHVEFPRWLGVLLNNIMEHTAHLVDTRVPLYNLTGAQDALERAYGEENVITEKFSFAEMSRVFRTCQLYDYASHRWLTFDGVPTTAPRVLERESLYAALARAPLHDGRERKNNYSAIHP